MNKLDLKEGQTYICSKSDIRWFTVGKEYPVFLDSDNEPAIKDDDGDDCHSGYLSACNIQFKLKETPPEKKGKDAFSFTKYGKLMFSMNELLDEAVERKYTPFEVTKVIIKAYQLYDKDSQVLAYIEGYFAK
ncbi:TPA: hypothetical protein QFP50_002444 [Enterococcus faecium]